MSKTYATLPEWTSAMERALEMGSQLIGDLAQREQLHTMRQALATIVALEADRLPAPVVEPSRIVLCRTCGAPMAFRGKVPMNVVDGRMTDITHFATCPQSGQWSKSKRPKQ